MNKKISCCFVELSSTCANTALKYDPKNLNAMLLKAQTLERLVLKQTEINKKSEDYIALENQLAQLYTLGYREMPIEMQQLFYNDSVSFTKDYTPKGFQTLEDKTPYITLSNGKFEEVHTKKAEETYFNTVFDTKTKKIRKIDPKLTAENINTDLVVFALSIDPLHADFVWNSPYAFSENRVIDAIELEGLEKLIYTKSFIEFGDCAQEAISNSEILTKVQSKFSDPKKSHIEIYYSTVTPEELDAKNTWNGRTVDINFTLGEYQKILIHKSKVDAYNKKYNTKKTQSSELVRQKKQFELYFDKTGLSLTEIECKVEKGEDLYLVLQNKDELAKTSYNINLLKESLNTYFHESETHVLKHIQGDPDAQNQVHIHKEGLNFEENKNQFSPQLIEGIEKGGMPNPNKYPEGSHYKKRYEDIKKAVNETEDYKN